MNIPVGRSRRAVLGAVLASVSAFAVSGCGGSSGHASLVQVPVSRCPTAFGVQGEKTKTPPATMPVTLASAVARKVSFYAGAITVLGPAGGKCASSEGADGSAGITIVPTGGDPQHPTAGVTVQEVPACQGCMADLVCAFFPAAGKNLGYSFTCSGSSNLKDEIVTHVAPNVVRFEDPANVRGNGANSGGVNPVQGLVFYLPPHRKWSDDAARIECALPASKSDVCSAVLDDYLAQMRSTWGAQFNASWPKSQAQPATTTTQAAPGAAQPGYLAYASNGVLFIQWTRAGNTVTGTLAESYADLSNPTQISHESHTFTGVINGSSITITLDSGDNWNGTITGSSVTLNAPPGSNGQISSFTFRPATVADYNAAVQGVNGQGQAAQQAHAQQQAAQKARDQVTSDANAISSDISSLQNDVSQLNTDLGQLPTDLRQMHTDLATQKQDLNHLLAHRSSCSSGGDYQVSSTDNYQVTSTDDYQITSTDEYSITNDEQSVTGDVTQLRTHAQAAVTDQAAASGYVPAGMPSASAVQSAIGAANAALTTAKKKWAEALQTVKSLDAQSNTYAHQADAACKNA
jgi:hypothetical protein